MSSTIIDNADMALLTAKNHGKNMIRTFSLKDKNSIKFFKGEING